MIIDILKERFNKNKDRHPMLEWEQVENALLADPLKLAVLEWMEESGELSAPVNVQNSERRNRS